MMNFPIDIIQISTILMRAFYTLVLATLAVIAFWKSRSFGKPAVSAGIAFTILLLVCVWNIVFPSLFSLLGMGISDHMTAFAINNLFSVFFELLAMGVFYKAIFLDRSKLAAGNERPCQIL